MKADHSQMIRLLKTARGQIDGIIKMVEDDRYCLDISHQIMASQAILKRANKDIIAAHMKHCLMEASEEELEQKVDEMIKMIDTLMKRL